MLRTLWITGTLLAAAVSAVPAQADTTVRPPPPPPKSSSTQISYVDIERVGGAVGSALDAVRLLRPRWLKAREVLTLPSSGADMEMQEIHVFLEDRDMGGLDFLSSIPAGQVYTLRYLSLTEAAARYGLSRGAAGPGIVVTLHR